MRTVTNGEANSGPMPVRSDLTRLQETLRVRWADRSSSWSFCWRWNRQSKLSQFSDKERVDFMVMIFRVT